MNFQDNVSRLAFLTEKSQQLLTGCQVSAYDGTVLYLPVIDGDYKALWARDFAYMVEYAGDMIPDKHIEDAIRYLLRGQRSDGAFPDRVRPDGLAIYSAGADGHPIGEANLDNVLVVVVMMDEFFQRLSPIRQQALFTEWAPQLDQGMEYLPLSEYGLIYNDPTQPHSPYGFTDTIRKTGELFFESLMYWDAARHMAKHYAAIANPKKAAHYQRHAATIETQINRLWDEQAGVFLAATQDCRQIDIWGNAFAIYRDFPLPSAQRQQILTYMAENVDQYVWRGQIRHLPQGEYWQSFLIDVPPETYQNGAYWATATGWVLYTLAQADSQLAERVLSDVVEDFAAHGIYECVNGNYVKLDHFVVSATNTLAGVRRIAAQLGIPTS